MKLNARNFPSLIAFLVLFAPSERALPVVLNCDRAATKTEAAICSDENLRRLDMRLSSVYGKLARARSQQRDPLRQAQMAWLRTRDQCGTDENCIQGSYEERIEALQAQLREAIAYKPDSVDRQALEDLRLAVDAMRGSDPELPLERVIDRLRIKTGMTFFANEREDAEFGGGANFPTTRPSGVTSDEWRAFRASGIDGEGARTSYMLMDMDGDGRRDLVIDYDIGGTGMFLYTNVLHRNGGKFVGAYSSLQGADDAQEQGAAAFEDNTGQSYLYAVGVRGFNQASYWISLRGRVYAAYRSSAYGVDTIHLLRPLTIVDEVPTLTVRYRYQLSVPKVQALDGKAGMTTLDNTWHAALTHSLSLVSSEATGHVGGLDAPLCPIPETVRDADSSSYYSDDPPHYTIELVADVPIWVGRQCYIGRMINWFGRYYPKDGLEARLLVRKPGDDTQGRVVSIRGVRSVVPGGVSTSMAKFGSVKGM
ncbi:lysozyme inhibitor LprI family protein [Cupriavidus basilensis]|uniref:lysozyme inhibitor LprI family protein n=1 Tax=Cupriavidus basilensis TaxID=68895 RepID=UPI0023E843EE|nr:lysozyme inhibitor LprI family protein [Cupriavidus basilensis]MDF3887886.1 lysozyme inhibitor LprI family protein [Cupriavidus basilensis]